MHERSAMPSSTYTNPPGGSTASASSVPQTTSAPEVMNAAAGTAAHASHTSNCWKIPTPFLSAPFDVGLASVVWTRSEAEADDRLPGPLKDVPASELAREWPSDKRERLRRLLPKHDLMARRRYGSCAVVGSSPELLLYEDGATIDAHDAVFRANLAVTDGFEAHAGGRTSVRIINPVESVVKARSKGKKSNKKGKGSAVDPPEIIIKNQDPPAIRSPSHEHAKWMGEVERSPELPNYLARREVLELCNYMMIAAGLASGPSPLPAIMPSRTKQGKRAPRTESLQRPLNVTSATVAFRRFVNGEVASWHPLGDKIPRFSPSHCSTGTVLLVQALLLCERTRLYGFHACSCKAKCADEAISARNHYWDEKETKLFDQMMSRYENHMHFYQLLETACEVDFKIARTEHCDREDGKGEYEAGG